MGRSLSKAQKVPDMKKNNKEEIHKKTNESKIPE